MSEVYATIRALNQENGKQWWRWKVHLRQKGGPYAHGDTDHFGGALSMIEAHLRLWGVDTITLSKAIADCYRSARRRYGRLVYTSMGTSIDPHGETGPEPYPD